MQTPMKHEGGTLTLFNASKVAKKQNESKKRQVTDNDLADFLTNAQNKVSEDYSHFSATTEAPLLGITKGRRYARLVVMKHGQAVSAFGFVDMQNGDVLKAAGWSAPAKNFARGNIFDKDNGTARVYWTGVQ